MSRLAGRCLGQPQAAMSALRRAQRSAPTSFPTAGPAITTACPPGPPQHPSSAHAPPEATPCQGHPAGSGVRYLHTVRPDWARCPPLTAGSGHAPGGAEAPATAAHARPALLAVCGGAEARRRWQLPRTAPSRCLPPAPRPCCGRVTGRGSPWPRR